MQPVAKALDTLQAEERCFMGILLPTLASLSTRLQQVKVTLKTAVPLADAILAGLRRRFGDFEQRQDLIKASVSHPQFKLRWMSTDAAKLNGKALLLEAMHAVSLNSESTGTLSSDEGDGFFCYYETTSVNNTVSSELEMYLNDSSNDINSLHRFPLVKKVFIQTNTALPFSAPVERLFSLGGQILTPRRNGLTDEHLEMLLLTRANRHLCDF